MIKISELSRFTLIIFICTSFMRCMTGGTSETGNARTAKVTGTVLLDTNKTTTPLVRLVNKQYIPGTKATDKVFLTVPDDNGDYEFDSIPWDNYYVYSKEGTLCNLRGPFEVSHSQIDIGNDTLHATSLVTLQIPQGSSHNFAFVKGTIETFTIKSDSVRLTVPSGTVTIITGSDTLKQSKFLPDSSLMFKAITVATKENESIKISTVNLPPVISSVIKDTTLISGSFFQFVISATDPEHDPIRYSLINYPVQMHIDSVSGIITWSIPASFPDSSISITAQVRDLKGASRNISWTITTINQNQQPAAPKGPVSGILAVFYLFSVDTSNLDNRFDYRFSFGDSDSSAWSSNKSSYHAWKTSGTYQIKFQSRLHKDTNSISVWSQPHQITISATLPTGTISADSITTGDTLRLQLRNCSCVDSLFPQYFIYWGDKDSSNYGANSFLHVYSHPGTFYISARFYCDTASPHSYSSIFPIDTIIVRMKGLLDTIPPKLSLKGADSISIGIGDTFIEPGYSAIDETDGDLTSMVNVKGTVNSLVSGIYTITYSVSDLSENSSTRKRFIIVRKAITLPPSGPDSGFTGELYPFFADTLLVNDTTVYKFSWGNGDSSAWVNRSYLYHSWQYPGDYNIQIKTWNLSEQPSEWSPPHRIVIYQKDSLPSGYAYPNVLSVNDTFLLQLNNCRCSDSSEPEFSSIYWGNGDTTRTNEYTSKYAYKTAGWFVITATYSCNSGAPLIPGIFTIDSVIVQTADSNAPSLKLYSNDSIVILSQGTPFIEPGFRAVDDIDGDITSKVVIQNPLDITKPGPYTITYTIKNSRGKTTTKIRQIIVR